MNDPPNIDIALNLQLKSAWLNFHIFTRFTVRCRAHGNAIQSVYCGSQSKANAAENQCRCNETERTFSVESGKKLMPFGMTSAIRDEAHTRHVSKNALHVRSCSLWRQPYGHPRITVFGFMPPNPIVWTLYNPSERKKRENRKKKKEKRKKHMKRMKANIAHILSNREILNREHLSLKRWLDHSFFSMRTKYRRSGIG